MSERMSERISQRPFCTVHTDVEADGHCAGCKRPVCAECRFDDQLPYVCTRCYDGRDLAAESDLLAIAFLNLAFVYTTQTMGLIENVALPGLLLIAGAIAMPTVCFLSAFVRPLRHLFFIPVGCLVGGVLIFLFTGVLS